MDRREEIQTCIFNSYLDVSKYTSHYCLSFAVSVAQTKHQGEKPAVSSEQVLQRELTGHEEL